MAKFQDLYQRELHHIRNLAKEFSYAHPNIAPMLRESSSDPDVERLLEGFAYISAQIQEIIDDQIPEFSGGLIKKFFPHYLRPIPSATIMHFKPKAELSEAFKVKKGASFSSIEVNGVKCLFRLCSDCEIFPIDVVDAKVVNTSGDKEYIEVSLMLSGTDLSTFELDTLKFHLNGSYADQAQLYYILLRYVESVEVLSEESSFRLPSDSIVAEGFSDDEAILPYPSHANVAYRILQEYFLMPEKYLYITIKNLSKWKDKGNSNQFKIRFYLKNHLKSLPEVNQSSFLLHTAPAINLFEYDAKPIVLNHMQYQYPIQSDASETNYFPIYRVKHVEGYQQGKVQAKEYINIDDIKEKDLTEPTYDIVNKTSISGEGLDHYITILYNKDKNLNIQETLSIRLECSNGTLPEYLAKGEISLPTSNSPSLLHFENIYTPTTYKVAPDDDDWMWRLQSMLAINYLSIANAENLRSLLQFHLFLNKNRHVTRSNFQRQIDSIESVDTKTVNRMVSGILMQGQHITIKLKLSDFASEGEAFLFISVLDRFFAIYVALNSFTQVELIDSSTGESIIWPMRMGEQLLI